MIGALRWDGSTLFAPKATLSVTTLADIRKQEDILLRLLTDYTDRFYKALKTGYEGQFYDITQIDDGHFEQSPNGVRSYQPGRLNFRGREIGCIVTCLDPLHPGGHDPTAGAFVPGSWPARCCADHSARPRRC